MAGIYVHYPYCIKKCRYCDFYSEDKWTDDASYISALQQEIALRSVDPQFKDQTFQTLYLGGGTPSKMSAASLQFITSRILDNFSFDPDPEMTLEANPGTLSFQKLKDILAAGINRLSIGVQSFQNDELELLGRMHSVQEAEASIHFARKAGFENIGIDLIYGIPDQTLTGWKQSLEKAVSISPEHISAYALSWHGGTLIGQAIQQGVLPEPDVDLVAEMQFETSRYLSKYGYEHYEISNFCLPGYYSKHNQSYWDGSPYLGFGPSAHSFVENKRFWNVRNVKTYIDHLSDKKLPVDSEERLNEEDKKLEAIALGLRTRKGILKNLVLDKNSEIELLIEKGFCRVDSERIYLTETGFLLTDEIATRLSI